MRNHGLYDAYAGDLTIMRTGSSRGDSEVLGTVARTSVILRTIAEANDGITTKTLSSQLSLPSSTIHRLLNLLVGQGFIERDKNGRRYYVGREFFRLGALVVDKTHVLELALPHMRMLKEKANEFCVLTLYLPAQRATMIVQTAGSSHSFTRRVEKFKPSSVAWGARSHAILAWLSEEEQRFIYANAPVSPATGNALPQIEEFLATLSAIRRRGYAYTRAEKQQGVVGVAAPLFSARGSVFGSLSVAVSESR